MIPFDKLLDLTPLATGQKEYLSEVYGLLAGTVLCTALGLKFAQYVVALPLLLSALGQFACVMYITSTQGRYQSYKDRDSLRRLGVLAGLSFLSGSSLASLVDYANYINPSILPTAFLATGAAFFCFSVAAMFSKERKFLYLGSVLSSVLLYLSMVSFFNIFFGSSFAHDVVLYGGLIVYLGFILYDTQAILHEHKMGIRDPVLHALTFYVNIIGVFLRLVQILIQREQRAREEAQQKRRR